MEKVPTYIKPKPIFYCIFDFTKGKGYFSFTFKPKCYEPQKLDRKITKLLASEFGTVPDSFRLE